MTSRIFNTDDFIVESDGEPVRSVVTESADSVIIIWNVMPGQQIKPHIHPEGQDTWIVLSGEGEYISSADGERERVGAGQVIIAHRGEVHGVINKGREPFQFISVVAPAEAGFEAF